jgi:hypothetical protein
MFGNSEDVCSQNREIEGKIEARLEACELVD